MRFPILISTLALALGLAVSANAGQLVIKVAPDADSVYHHDQWSGGYYNYTDKAASPNTASYYYYYSDGGGYTRTTMTFDMSSVVGDVQSATFSFNLLGANNGYGADVGCGKLTHGSTNVLLVSTQPLGWVTVDVTSLVLDDLSKGTSSVFTMTNTANGYGNCGMSFSSGEDAAFAPRLTLTTVPEPSTLFSLFVGGTGYAVTMLRRRRA